MFFLFEIHQKNNITILKGKAKGKNHFRRSERTIRNYCIDFYCNERKYQANHCLTQHKGPLSTRTHPKFCSTRTSFCWEHYIPEPNTHQPISLNKSTSSLRCGSQVRVHKKAGLSHQGILIYSPEKSSLSTACLIWSLDKCE